MFATSFPRTCGVVPLQRFQEALRTIAVGTTPIVRDKTSRTIDPPDSGVPTTGGPDQKQEGTFYICLASRLCKKEGARQR